MELGEKLQECQRSIQTVFGKEFAELDVSQIFYWPAVSITKRDIKWPTQYYFKVSFKQLFNARNRYELKPGRFAKLLFFNQTNRSDHVETFKKVTLLSPESDVVQVDVVPKSFASPKVCLRRMHQLLCWVIKKRKTDLSWREFWFAVPYAQQALEAKRQFQHWDLTRYSAVVFYYDFNWISDVLRQMAKAKGIKAVTLQHGIYFTKSVFPEENNDLCVRSSNADVFLAWSELTKKMLEETGFPKENIQVMGVPRYLDRVRVPMSRDKTKGVFGVVSSIAEYEDRQIIQIACDIAEQTGWNFYVRYHPNQQGNEYDRFISSPWYIGSDRSEQYSEKVDFSLVGRSTMLVDLVAQGKRVYHYIDERGYGAYTADECSFCNAQDVIEMEKNLDETESQWNALRELLIGPENAKENYVDFFQTLENEL